MGLLLRAYRGIRRPFEKPTPERSILFLHIPKCGGSSVDRAFRAVYARPSKPAHSIAFRLNAAASLRGSRLTGQDQASYTEQLLLYQMSLKNLSYISGHFNFSEIAYREFADRWDFITILRDPVSRWFSHYFYNRYKESDHFKTDQDLPTFLASDEGAFLGHFYVYMLTGRGAGTRSVEDAAIREAIGNLQKFALVGCLEHLDSFTADFRTRYGVPLDIGTERTNPLSRASQQEQITEDIRRQVEQICRPDLEVYRWALERFTGKGRSAKSDRTVRTGSR